MRPRCGCGKIAGYWYGPSVKDHIGDRKITLKEFLDNKVYCDSCADVDNWAEYWWIGFHKKDWRWLKISKLKEKYSDKA